jgi:hypothetical protein
MARVAFAAACAVLFWGVCVRARAQDGEEGEVHVGVDTREHLHAHGAAHEHEHEHKPLSLGLDFVLGFGAFPVTAPLRGAEGWGTLGSIKVNSESFIISGGYEVAEGIGVGARIPLTAGSVPALGDDTHGTFAFGNIELEGEVEVELSETAELVLSLGVALPTAQGSEEPELEDGELSSAYDQFVLNRIAAASRGFEDNALYEVDRLGIIPKVALHAREGRMLFQPYVKLENLIATNSELERGYIAELVFGSFLGVQASEHFDLGARVWGSAAFLDEVEMVGVVEPQVRAHYAPVDVVLGGIIPFAGELTDPQFGGIRLGVTAHL